MEEAQTAEEAANCGTEKDEPRMDQSMNIESTDTASGLVRTNTPTLREQASTEAISLPQFESIFHIVGMSTTELHGLQHAPDVPDVTTKVSFLQPDEDASSSLCDPLPLPGGLTQDNNLGDHSEEDRTEEELSQTEYPPLYATIPTLSELGSERGEVTETESQFDNQPGPSKTTMRSREEQSRELSGRSRVLLKQNFASADP